MLTKAEQNRLDNEFDRIAKAEKRLDNAMDRYKKAVDNCGEVRLGLARKYGLSVSDVG